MAINPLLPVVIVYFNCGVDPVLYHLAEWNEGGKYRGFLKRERFSIREIDHVEYKQIKTSELPTKDWMDA